MIIEDFHLHLNLMRIIIATKQKIRQQSIKFNKKLRSYNYKTLIK